MRHVLLFSLAIAGCSSGSSPGPGGGLPPPPQCVNTFVNPIIVPGADPWVVRQEGWYYLVQSRNRGVYVYKSQKLTDLKRNEVLVWSAPTTGWNRENIWAPEIHYIDGRWYVYYTAGPSGPTQANEFINQRSFVLRARSDDPQGAYDDLGMLYTGDDVTGRTDPKWAIDLTVGRIRGVLYAVWSGWEENNTVTHRVPQHLYIARMSDPTTIASSRVQISSPTASWEDGAELDLQEGPELLEGPGQRLFIIYSTRESWLPTYRLGQLRLAGPDVDPLSRASWIKSDGPVFTGTSSVHGVGHAGFAKSPDGTEDWILYHSKTTTTPGWEDRVIRIQKFGWNADGSPSFGTPTPAGQPITVPSGECP
jgi:GH43 family beta-xylosidase